jgi:HAMP domain-containing protein
VSQQVAQVANDPTLPVDQKAKQISALAAQFNQLVSVWQQQVMSQTGGVGAQTTPVPVSSAAVSPLVGSTPTPAASATPGPVGSTTSDELRAQIAAVSQKMATVSNDPTIPADARSVQLQDLGNQFNQLMQQLQQTS